MVLISGFLATTLVYAGELAVWYLSSFIWSAVIDGWFPDVGVSISAFDQILGLCTGIVAVLLTVKSVCRVDWKRFLGHVGSGMQAVSRRTGQSQSRGLELTGGEESGSYIWQCRVCSDSLCRLCSREH
ncbi:hypothetical protein V8F33_013984 [Rhypophila sp. PSN 637]